ncbi:actin-related protein 2/3 complex subunit 1A-B-like isoform X3 [Haliotis rubra]|uniref:actin-related protein 2/3 complex subunit 1A-B-like isoform X3 n=1 Tax=Haliotis rubra TaxID=36100 RepID=UPI001EE55AEB|nr:actin-related protein 2/3 complex subunit 1A-B-like isoform X3 [Haliotis rubra]
MSEKHNFGMDPVTCHAFSGDRKGLVLSQKSPEVKIYKQAGTKWQLADTLTEHGQRVTGIDWAPNSNRIVTCGADRNAYVWSLESNGKWKPMLVILRINRAATCVKWSPQENKFAVGSGARLISVSYYEEDNNWWVSKHIKKPIRSTVTCLDWHANNVLIAAGSSDFKARVFSGYIKEVDKKPGPCSWGTKMPWGTNLAEFSNGGETGSGWVHSVSFSPSGDRLAWVGHDSSISVVDSNKGSELVCIKENFLPFMSITWVTENSIVCAEYDCNPMLFTYTDSGKLNAVSKLDIPQEKESGQISAMNRFKNLEKKATTDDFSSDLKTQHQNTITQVSIFAGTKSDCTKISTSGVDGNIIIWDLKSLEAWDCGTEDCLGCCCPSVHSRQKHLSSRRSQLHIASLTFSTYYYIN